MSHPKPDPKPILCLDIGSGTQDVLLYFPDRELENCPKLVLPAPARVLAGRIREVTAQGNALHLFGHNMGGGFGGAVRAHLAAGLAVSVTESAAYSLADDLDALRAQGYAIMKDCGDCPEGAVALFCADYDPAFWNTALDTLGLPRPERVAACAQDHGFHPGQSNRRGRFVLWERLLLEAEGRPESLLFAEVPPEFTRLAALQRSIGGGPVADTGAAAVLGALFEPSVRTRAEERGLTLVNIGNSHTVAFLVFAGRIWGVYEHHTGLLDAGRLWAQLERFRRGELGFEEIFDDRGHGTMRLALPVAAQGFAPTLVLGPRRGLLAGYDVEFPAPGGDMMLTGAFGLVEGLRLRAGLPRPERRP
ncbi:MAG: DUF1786 domain-containing protein [Humidesulfovibrio sp.]|nr:hypothetical protein [Desulfovibrio sp.]MDO9083473.1 DUF1786 domain-containing protein [Humidesulfovibrio sp.]